MNLVRRFSPLQLSILFHASILLIALLMSLDLWRFKKFQVVDLDVYTDPVVASLSQPVQPVEEKVKPPEPAAAPRKVFGVSRKSITTTNENGLEVKAGNTVAKEKDDLELNKDDADSIPIPVADYLITEEPIVISEPKNKQRTEEARKNGYTGTAKLKILIDVNGNVRDVKLLNSLKYGLDERAIELARQVKLSPAKVNGKPVNVLRDFTITFKATD